MEYGLRDSVKAKVSLEETSLCFCRLRICTLSAFDGLPENVAQAEVNNLDIFVLVKEEILGPFTCTKMT